MMDIDRLPAGCAGPAFLFRFDEIAYAVFPNRLKVVDHAHAVLLPVPRVQLPEPFAGIFSTFMMMPALYLFAGRNGAALVAPTVRCITPATPVLFPEKCHTDRAVHAAGGNQCCLKGVFHRHKGG